MHRLRIEVTRFTVVGGVNFILTFVIFFVLVRVLRTNHLAALTLAWLVGTLFSYVANYVWVFRPERNLTFRSRLVKFFAAGLVSLLANLWALDFLVAQFSADPFFAQCFLMPFVVAFNFTTAKFWSLNRPG